MGEYQLIQTVFVLTWLCSNRSLHSVALSRVLPQWGFLAGRAERTTRTVGLLELTAALVMTAMDVIFPPCDLEELIWGLLTSGLLVTQAGISKRLFPNHTHMPMLQSLF